MPEEDRFEDREWHHLYFQAFDLLQFDRNITASGAELPLYYQALSRYCADFGIVGEDRRRFILFINTVDAEYMKLAAERAEARNKSHQTAQHEHQ